MELRLLRRYASWCLAVLFLIGVGACGETPTGDGDPIVKSGSYAVSLATSSEPAAGLILRVSGLSSAPQFDLSSGMTGKAVVLGAGEYRVLVTGVTRGNSFMDLTVADDRNAPIVEVVEAAGSSAQGYGQIVPGGVELNIDNQ